MVTSVIINTDGAARGNPGPAGLGYVITDPSGMKLDFGSRYFGETTNNVAEYEALLLGLTAARRLGARDLLVRMDSELVVHQVTGRYKVKHPGLAPLHARVQSAIATFQRVRFERIPRELNSCADRLASTASRGR